MADLQTFQIPYDIGYVDGEGINLLTGESKGRLAFDTSTIELITTMHPSDIKQLHELVETESKYKSMQEASVDIKGSKSSVKVSSGLKLMLKHSFDSKTIVATSIGSMKSGDIKYDNTKLKLASDALTLLETNVDDFVSTYGTHFIGGYVLGAYFDSFISFKFHSSTDVAKIKSKIKVGFNASRKAGSGAVTHDLELEEVYHNTDADGKFDATGISGEMTINRIEDMNTAFSNFSENGKLSEEKITAICYPYTLLNEVQAVLNTKGSELIQNYNHGLVDSICLEYRNLERALTKISAHDDIATRRGEALQSINHQYKAKLVAKIGSIKDIKPKELTALPTELLDAVGENSAAAKILAEWQTKFTNEYNKII